jgi:hypothetical protein
MVRGLLWFCGGLGSPAQRQVQAGAQKPNSYQSVAPVFSLGCWLWDWALASRTLGIEQVLTIDTKSPAWLCMHKRKRVSARGV